jgi:hypothetical protein
VNEDEVARAVAEGIRRERARVVVSPSRACLGCVLVAAIIAVAVVALSTWNPGG